MFQKIGILLVITLALGAGCKKTGEDPNAAARLQAERNIEFEKTMQALTASDHDFDGLGDEEEKKLGSDPNDPDTDSDGITDYDEVKTYKTNVLKSDSDGDGRSDGYEVRRGFDPLR